MSIQYRDSMPYADAEAIRRDVARAIRAPRRQSVAESMRQSLRLKGPGGRYEPWQPNLTPYMVEAAEACTDRTADAGVFMGPARTGKSVVVDGMICHALTAQPLDMCLVHMTQDTARYYSKSRLDGIIRNSPDMAAGLSPLPRDDNVYDKFGRTGQVIRIAWPTINQLSGTEFQWVAATDVDRMPDDINGEGDIFGILLKRVTTYLSAGYGFFESSPGRDFADGNWKPSERHEAPPVNGIAGLYNLGDRRRFYWHCKDCAAPIMVESSPEMFGLPGPDSLREEIQSADLDKMTDAHAVIACRECGAAHYPSDRRALNMLGTWVPGRQSKIRSWWLGGPAAGYQTWQKLVAGYLQAVKHWALTGDEEPLRRSITQDWGGVYQPLATQHDRATAEDLMQRAEAVVERAVPDGVLVLVAAVDVQKDRFVVQITGYGAQKERWLVDRYNIRHAVRTDHGGDRLKIDPAAYHEDWESALLPLIEKSYPLNDGSGRRMRIRLTLCDLGGAEGVTTNAYLFSRKVRQMGLSPRFLLVKGATTPAAPRWEVRYPDTRRRKNRKSGSAGDVAVLFVGTNLIKDALAGDLRRPEPGPGYIHFPKWLGGWFYREMTRETRTQKGWQQRSGNEAWDLLCYAEAGAGYLGIEKINWDAPAKPWALPWDQNSEVFQHKEGETAPKTSANARVTKAASRRTPRFRTR